MFIRLTEQEIGQLLIVGTKAPSDNSVTQKESFFDEAAKLTNCCIAAVALVTAAYPGTPYSTKIARLAFSTFCLAIQLFILSHESIFWGEVLASS
jgi:hypothetical protein